MCPVVGMKSGNTNDHLFDPRQPDVNLDGVGTHLIETRTCRCAERSDELLAADA